MEYLFPSLLIIGSFLTAAACVALILLAQSYSIRSRRSLMWSIALIVGVGIAVSNIGSGRNISFVGQSLQDLYEVPGGPFITYFERISNLMIFIIGLGGCLERIWARDSALQKVPGRKTWLIAIVLFSGGVNIFSSLLGSHPRFAPGLFYSLPALCLLALDGRWVRTELIQLIRNISIALIVLGFAVTAFRPEMTIERRFVGFMAVLPIRYWGIAPHANAMGALGVVAVLLLFHQPFRSRVLTSLMFAAAMGTVILAQSKTSYIALTLSLVTIFYFRTLSKFRNVKSLGEMSVISVLGLTCISMTVVGLVVVLTTIPEIVDALARMGKTGESVLTLSGRMRIWEAAVSEWRQNPLFGYGPDLFGIEHRLQLGMLFAFHGHNQFVHTLGQSGLIGLISLVLFLTLCAVESFRRATETGGISIAILTLIIIRCMTEVPLRSGTVLSIEFLTLLYWLAVLIPCPTISLMSEDSRRGGADRFGPKRIDHAGRAPAIG